MRNPHHRKYTNAIKDNHPWKKKNLSIEQNKYTPLKTYRISASYTYTTRDPHSRNILRLPKTQQRDHRSQLPIIPKDISRRRGARKEISKGLSANPFNERHIRRSGESEKESCFSTGWVADDGCGASTHGIISAGKFNKPCANKGAFLACRVTDAVHAIMPTYLYSGGEKSRELGHEKGRKWDLPQPQPQLPISRF